MTQIKLTIPGIIVHRKNPAAKHVSLERLDESAGAAIEALYTSMFPVSDAEDVAVGQVGETVRDVEGVRGVACWFCFMQKKKRNKKHGVNICFPLK